LGSQTDPIFAQRHSNIYIKGFGNVSTSAPSQRIKGLNHSSIEIDSIMEIPTSGGPISGSPSAFGYIDLAHLCSFGSQLCPGVLDETLVYSHVYQI